MLKPRSVNRPVKLFESAPKQRPDRSIISGYLTLKEGQWTPLFMAPIGLTLSTAVLHVVDTAPDTYINISVAPKSGPTREWEYGKVGGELELDLGPCKLSTGDRVSIKASCSVKVWYSFLGDLDR